MYGAILGDIAGSIYEFENLKTDKPETIDLLNPEGFFTDDTVLTCAVAQAVLGDRDYRKAIYQWARLYPNESWGPGFRSWFKSSNPRPYNSWGNGSAMRVSPIGWAFETLEETLAEAKRSAECTHNHPEGIKGAQATAAAIFLARKSGTKKEIKAYIEKTFGYDLSRTVAEIRPVYEFNESCQGTVPEAIIVFLESRDFPNALQSAISIGGDSDTLAAITGGIAEAFYRNIPAELIKFADSKITAKMRALVQQIFTTTG